MKPFKTLLLETRDEVAVVTINRPEALNALNREVIAELHECFGDHLHDDAIRCVIITGAGEKAFVAGADIRELAGMNREAATALAVNAQNLMQAIQDCPLPVIAAINGFALGGGCELALACDIRLAATTARLGQPEINLGLIPGFGGTQRLARLVGRGKAMQLILTGTMIPATEALRIGLVDAVHAPQELMPGAMALAQEIAAKAPIAVRYAKQALQRGLELPLPQGCALEADLFGRLFATQDQKEGTAAFLGKREPRFTGK